MVDVKLLDPNYKEEAVMGGRMTITMNTHGDVYAVQKGGGVGVSQSEIKRCFHVASAKAADITAKLKECVEAHAIERAQMKIKCHRSQVAAASNDSIKMNEATLHTAQKQVDKATEIEKVILSKSNNKNEIDIEEDESEDEHTIPAQVHNRRDKKETKGHFHTY